MFARPGSKKRRIGFVGGALAVTVVSVVLTRTAFARITVNGSYHIDRRAMTLLIAATLRYPPPGLSAAEPFTREQ